MILRRDEAFRIVCKIHTFSDVEKTKWEAGTGMFIYNDENNVWIVTASHIAKNTTKQSLIFICDENNNSIKIDLQSLCFNNDWQFHKTADIAVIRIEVNDNNRKLLMNRCFPLEQISAKKIAPSRDYELTAIGFPLGLGVNNKFYPFTFRSYASSNILELTRFDTNTMSDFFCLENPNVGGYSGCSVLDLGYKTDGIVTEKKEKSICYGIMHGTIIDETGGKIAVVTPSYYIYDLV